MKTQNYNNLFFISRKNIFTSIREIVQDNTDTAIIVPNVCSTNIKAISKFSALAYKNYPIVYDNFALDAVKKIGSVQFITAYQQNKNKSAIVFANMVCQTAKPINNRTINYGALALCMMNASSYCKNLSKDYKVQIHSPKFGTGFAGGDWTTISNLINDIWCADFITYIYEPKYND